MTRQITLVGLLVAIILAISSFTLVVNAFDPGGPPAAGGIPKIVTGNWEWINYQPTGGSYSPQFEINHENVQYLGLQWIFPYTAVESLFPSQQGGSGAPVIIVDGVAYVGKNNRAIHAVDATTGKEVWFSDEQSNLWDRTALHAEFPFFQNSQGHTHGMNYYRGMGDSGWLITSNQPCLLSATNAADGSIAWSMGVEQLCGTAAEYGNPEEGIVGSFGSKGRISGQSNHPPNFHGDIMVWPIMGASGGGGRSSVKGFDMSDPNNPTELWRTWLMPDMRGNDPDWAITQCDIVDGNGWYFSAPDFFESGTLAINCKDVPDDVVRNDWINMKPDTPHFGEVHTASAMSVIWGNMPIDPTTGIIYIGTGDVGPYTNSSYKYGPNLYGSSVVAIDSTTGDIVWWFHSNPHDLWDWDCSWGGLLAKAQGTNVLIMGCKNGMAYALNAATGEPVWVWEAPTTWRTAPDTNYGVDVNGNPGVDGDACCRMIKEHMGKDWLNYPNTAPTIMSPWLAGALESDMAFNGKYVFIANYNDPRWTTTENMREFGNQATNIEMSGHPVNTTIYAVDVNTGEAAWSAFIPDFGFRGGLMTTGNVLYGYAGDGNLYMFNADTGELIDTQLFGVPISVMPTIGAGADGKHRIFLHIGGGGGYLYAHGSTEGSLAALGLPDVLPAAGEIVQQNEVIRNIEVEGPVREVFVEKEVEVILEVEKIIEREVEVVVERIVEVEKEVQVEIVTTEEVISPVSYVAIGLGVVLIVVAGVLFQRSKS